MHWQQHSGQQTLTLFLWNGGNIFFLFSDICNSYIIVSSSPSTSSYALVLTFPTLLTLFYSFIFVCNFRRDSGISRVLGSMTKLFSKNIARSTDLLFLKSLVGGSNSCIRHERTILVSHFCIWFCRFYLSNNRNINAKLPQWKLK